MIFAPSLATFVAALAPMTTVSPAPQDAQGDQDLLLFYCAGADALFVDEKDRGLLEALRLVDDRLVELPRELGGDPIPPDVLPLVARMLEGPMRLRAGIGTEEIAGLPFPFFAQLTLPSADNAGAREISGRIARLMEMGGMPPGDADPNGLTAMPLPVPAWYGARGDDFVMALGKTVDTAPHFGALGLPDGVKPSMAFRMDYGGIMETVMDVAEMSGEDPSEIQQIVDMMGLDGLDIRWAMGSDDRRAYSVATMQGYAATMRDMGTLPEAPLSQRAIGAVPMDAVWAYLATSNLQGTVDMVLAMLEEPLRQEGMDDPIEALAQFTGIHLENDIIRHMGSSFGAYTSDSTGGGGLLSLVIFFDLKDAESLGETADRIEEMLNGIAQAEAEGYVRTSSWESEGSEFTSLTFPGLPIPFEPTISFTDGFMFVGLTPQATLAAVAQARSGGTNVTHNKRFQYQMAGSTDDLFALSFVETARLLRDGYGVTSLMCSALANATRSPHDPSRSAGMILPPYRELSNGAIASVMTARLSGDDLVQETRSDRSLLVNMTALVGAITSGPLAPLALAIPFGLFVGQEPEAEFLAAELQAREHDIWEEEIIEETEWEEEPIIHEVSDHNETEVEVGDGR